MPTEPIVLPSYYNETNQKEGVPDCTGELTYVGDDVYVFPFLKVYKVLRVCGNTIGVVNDLGINVGRRWNCYPDEFRRLPVGSSPRRELLMLLKLENA